MQKVDLRPIGDGPYHYVRTVDRTQGLRGSQTIDRTEGIQRYQGDFFLRVYAERDQPTIAIFSDTPENFTHPNSLPVSAFLHQAVEALRRDLKIPDLEQMIVLHHQPENVRGNNAERHQKVEFYFDHNGLHQGYGKYARQDLTPQQVAELTGPENYEPLYERSEPRATTVPEPDPDQWKDFDIDPQGEAKIIAEEFVAAHPEPAPNEPAPNEPAPNEPAPNEPAPNEPAPNEPAPNEPVQNDLGPKVNPDSGLDL